MRFRRWAGTSLAIVTGLLGRSTEIVAQVPAPTRCAVGIPQSEASGYVPLPRGDVFCPLLADPKGMHSFVSYQRGKLADVAHDLGAVGIADEFAFFRSGSANTDNAVQLGASGGVFAQFDVGSASYDLLNAD